MISKNKKMQKFSTGAKRGTDVSGVPYHLLSQIALRRYAKAMAEGSIKYGKFNWLKGLPADNLVDHLYAHLAAFLEGDISEDHLGHALWNLATLVHFSETRPELFADLSPSKDKKCRSKSKSQTKSW